MNYESFEKSVEYTISVYDLEGKVQIEHVIS